MGGAEEGREEGGEEGGAEEGGEEGGQEGRAQEGRAQGWRPARRQQDQRRRLGPELQLQDRLQGELARAGGGPPGQPRQEPEEVRPAVEGLTPGLGLLGQWVSDALYHTCVGVGRSGDRIDAPTAPLVVQLVEGALYYGSGSRTRRCVSVMCLCGAI